VIFPRKDNVLAKLDIRRAALPLITVMAMIVIAMPVCQMAECPMPLGQPMQGMAPMTTMPGTTAFGVCDFMEMDSNALPAVLPPSAENMTLFFGVILAAFGGWAISLRSSRVVARDVIRSGASPPDPLGVRLIV
jgi:hypothetical protein